MTIDYYNADAEKFPLACLQKNVQLMAGPPSMAENSMRWSYNRNDVGYVTAVTQHGEGGSIALMTLRYDSLQRMAEQRWANGKSIVVGYRSSTLLLESLRDEAGVVRTIDARSGVGDLPQRIRLINDDASYAQTLGWDDQERLSSILHGLYPPGQSGAQQGFNYQLSSASRPGVLKETRGALDGQSYSMYGIHSSLGTILASAKASDHGYVYAERQFRSQQGFKVSTHAAMASPVEPLLAGIEDLKSDDEPITSQLSDVFGEAIATEHLYEKEVKGAMSVRLDLVDGFLRLTETQNGTWVRTRWIDGAGLVRRLKLENEAVFAFDYDWNGRLQRVMMPSGKYAEIDYDRMGRKSLVKRSEIGSIHYVYDDKTNLLSGKNFFDREGKKFRSEIHVHDGTGRLRELRHSDDKANISFNRSYDGDTAQGRSPHQKGFLTEVSPIGSGRTSV
jgi:hypothetical protein